MGAFGIVTHVTIRLREITELELETRFDDLTMTQEWFNNYFRDKASWDGPLFQQGFIDFHRMVITYGMWTESGKKRTPKDYPSILSNRAGSHGRGGAAYLPLADDLLDAMDVNYRTNDFIVKMLVRFSCEVPALSWKLNNEGENDAYWVSSLPSPMPVSQWGAWMFPVDPPDLSLLYKAAKVYYDRWQEAQEAIRAGTGVFRPDVALEFRFVWSSNSYFAPNYTDDPSSQLFVVVEYPTLSSNLYTTKEQLLQHDGEPAMIQLTKEYLKFFADVEQGWRDLDSRARPHLAKEHCFAPRADDPEFMEPYNKAKLGEILSPDRQAKLRAKLKAKDPSGIFMNNFISALVKAD